MAELITVITPFYNSEKLIEAVYSVLIQDYKRIEYIIIDDCSQPEIANECKERVESIINGKLESFIWVTHEQNQGTVKTVNEAWSMATGKYIFTLAHDDMFWNEHVISQWVEAFENTKADVMVGFRAIYDSELQDLKCLSPSPYEEILLKRNDVKKIQKRLYRSNFIFGCAVARTKESIIKFGLVPETYRLIEDYPMILRYYRMDAKVLLFEQIVVKYRSGGISTPQNVSFVYQNDTKLIYENEIIPYIKPRWFGRKLLNKQLKERERKCSYSVMRNKHNGVLWNLYCHFCYPEFFLAYGRMLIEKSPRKKQLQRIMGLSGASADNDEK